MEIITRLNWLCSRVLKREIYLQRVGLCIGSAEFSQYQDTIFRLLLQERTKSVRECVRRFLQDALKPLTKTFGKSAYGMS